MTQKLIKVALVGKTNAGKSTLINSFVGEKISVINKKINTTQDMILGIVNISNTQLIFYDTPGFSLLKNSNFNQKKLNTNLWRAIEKADIILYIVDSFRFEIEHIKKDIKKISEAKKNTILVFNKIDLINNNDLLFFIKELNRSDIFDSFFNISAKFNNGVESLINYLLSKSIYHKWIYLSDEITNKDDIFITNECTRNAILNFVHQEIPYNVNVRNIYFKYLKNHDLKIKQSIELKNTRYKPIILGKKGELIKRIREFSQNEISKVFKCKIHLYIQIDIINDR